MRKIFGILMIICLSIFNCSKPTSSFSEKNDVSNYGFHGKIKSVKSELFNLIPEKDTFRIGGFPEDFLLSLNQTLEFIEQHKSEISFSNNWLEKLEKFWRENPNGVI